MALALDWELLLKCFESPSFRGENIDVVDGDEDGELLKESNDRGAPEGTVSLLLKLVCTLCMYTARARVGYQGENRQNQITCQKENGTKKRACAL